MSSLEIIAKSCHFMLLRLEKSELENNRLYDFPDYSWILDFLDPIQNFRKITCQKIENF